MSSSEPIAVVTDLWGYLLSIDWYERWLWFLVGFHLFCSLLTMITVIFNSHNTQIALFLSFLGLVYCAEYINEWAAENYRLFSKQQYFDDKGMFISLLLSAPLLINCFVIVLHWMLSSIRTMIVLKRAKLRHEMKQSELRKDKWWHFLYTVQWTVAHWFTYLLPARGQNLTRCSLCVVLLNGKKFIDVCGNVGKGEVLVDEKKVFGHLLIFHSVYFWNLLRLNTASCIEVYQKITSTCCVDTETGCIKCPTNGPCYMLLLKHRQKINNFC